MEFIVFGMLVIAGVGGLALLFCILSISKLHNHVANHIGENDNDPTV